MTKGKALLTKIAVLFSAVGVFTSVFAPTVYAEKVKYMDLVLSRNILLDYNQYWQDTGDFMVDVEATVMGTRSSATTPVVRVILSEKTGLFEYTSFRSCDIKVYELRDTYSCAGTQKSSGKAMVKWQNIEPGSSVGGNLSAYSVYYK